MAVRVPEPDAAYVTTILADLVRINSINPAFSGGSTDEREIAGYVEAALGALGCEVTRHEPAPGRVSVTGRLPGTGGSSLMLYAHMDTVGIEGMAEPFSGAVRDGRLHGRGAYDMKCGLAACLGAVKALRDAGAPIAGDLVVCAVADEETESLGMRDVLGRVRTDAAIVTEPTELDLCIAHKGFCWIEVVTEGRAAHGSRFALGVDANMRMGRFLAVLDGLEQRLRASTPHPLLGPPSLHAAVLEGGTGTSTYAARCRLEIERRTLPGETAEQVMEEIGELLAGLRRTDPELVISHRLMLARDPFEVAPGAAIVAAVRSAAEERLGRPPAENGVSFWMDAALLASAGVETVVIGPAGAGAHAAEEWADMQSVVELAGILAAAAVRYWDGTPTT
jgi:acetylornithine deacetylase